MFLNLDKKGISPLIATILLVVVAVVIIGLILSWGKGFTNSSLDKTKLVFEEDPSLTGLISLKQYEDNQYIIKNNSDKNVTIKGYKILTDTNSDYDLLNTYLNFKKPVKVLKNSLNVISLICVPKNSFHINLITDKNNFISLKIYNNKNANLDKCSKTLKGNGWYSDPYIIKNIFHLYRAHNNLSAYYKLENDLDFDDIYTKVDNLDIDYLDEYEEKGFKPIGNGDNRFEGTFDGDGHKIKNLYINRPDTSEVALIGFMNYSKVENLSLEDIEYHGYNDVGGITGYFQKSDIRNTYVTGSIFANGDYIGGIAGYDRYSDIDNCYTLVSIYGNSYIGGLIGGNTLGNITNSYSVSPIIGFSNLGGLIGYNTGNVTYSYYDQNISNQNDTGKGIPLSTKDMQKKSSFSQWNFDDVWEIGDGYTYPYLQENKQIPAPSPNSILSVNASPKQGTYPALDLEVSLETLKNFKDSIYYTTNGDDPECSSSFHYTSPINITTGNTKIKATICINGNKGKINSFDYNLIDPVYVSTADELNNIRNDLTKLYVLENDIDLNVSPYNSGEGWVPIGNETFFEGGLDGNGHTINNLYIDNSNDFQSLFGMVSNAIINDVNLNNVSVSGNNYVSGIVGYNDNSLLKDLSVSGVVSGNESVGGITGQNVFGNIKKSSFDGNINASAKLSGGIAGKNWHGTIINSSSKGNLYSDERAGGLVGNNGGTITLSFSETNVYSGGSWYVGGLVGYNRVYIDKSYSTGKVYGSYYTGGFVGRNLEGQIKNSYSLGYISGTAGSAGFLGENNNGTVINCYSTGEVNNSYSNSGFLKNNLGNIEQNTYWDKVTSTKSYSVGSAIGYTTSQMQAGASNYDNWNFTNIWSIDPGSSYPYLQENEQIPHPN